MPLVHAGGRYSALPACRPVQVLGAQFPGFVHQGDRGCRAQVGDGFGVDGPDMPGVGDDIARRKGFGRLFGDEAQRPGRPRLTRQRAGLLESLLARAEAGRFGHGEHRIGAGQGGHRGRDRIGARRRFGQHGRAPKVQPAALDGVARQPRHPLQTESRPLVQALAPLERRRTAAATVRACSSVISGNIGSESTVAAASSATGKSPAL
ncbi:MAG: hypothetical protein BWZ10_03253 [candidate division BRC1 bacterium ADurb.BinA364]|nr:MAG: hypothetical protein BWZ10_03253 [candidate division BRC1 bacterium ADurb.BinA364]